MKLTEEGRTLLSVEPIACRSGDDCHRCKRSGVPKRLFVHPHRSGQSLAPICVLASTAMSALGQNLTSPRA